MTDNKRIPSVVVRRDNGAIAKSNLKTILVDTEYRRILWTRLYYIGNISLHWTYSFKIDDQGVSSIVKGHYRRLIGREGRYILDWRMDKRPTWGVFPDQIFSPKFEALDKKREHQQKLEQLQSLRIYCCVVVAPHGTWWQRDCLKYDYRLQVRGEPKWSHSNKPELNLRYQKENDLLWAWIVGNKLRRYCHTLWH